MKTFKQHVEACWTGYTAKGMKKKGNRMVPNCVPVGESKLNSADPHKDYAAKSKVLQDLSRNKDVDQKAVQQRRLDLDKEHSRLKEDGAMGGSAGPTNVVGGGAIAGTGGRGGEPGVHLKKKKSTVMMDIIRRKKP
jgi:hypothetical protein